MFSSVQSLSHVWLFMTLWTAARQASLSITNSQSLLKLTSTESVMPSNHLFLCHPLLLLPSVFPSIRVSFPMSQFFTPYGQSIGVSVFPMNIQDWFPLGWTGWISLQSKGLSRVFSNTTIQAHQFFDVRLSLCSLTFFTFFFFTFFTFFTFTSLTFLYILYNSTLCRSLMFYWTWLCPGCVCIFVHCNFILLFKSGWGIHYLYQTEESGHLFSFAVSTVN